MNLMELYNDYQFILLVFIIITVLLFSKYIKNPVFQKISDILNKISELFRNTIYLFWELDRNTLERVRFQ
jgi:hypothetical protein